MSDQFMSIIISGLVILVVFALRAILSVRFFGGTDIVATLFGVSIAPALIKLFSLLGIYDGSSGVEIPKIGSPLLNFALLIGCVASERLVSNHTVTILKMDLFERGVVVFLMYTPCMVAVYSNFGKFFF